MGAHRRCLALLVLLVLSQYCVDSFAHAPASRTQQSRRPVICANVQTRTRQEQQRRIPVAATPPTPPSGARAKSSQLTVLEATASDANADLSLPSYRKALAQTALLTLAAALFGGGIWYYMGEEKALEYFAGYILEESLSVDNLFVFVLLFEYFQVPAAFQGRVLSWGIFGALVFRGIFVGLGAVCISQFQGVLLGFAGILLFSSFQLFTEGDDDDGGEDLSENAVVQFASKVIDATDEYDGDRFFTSVDGARRATPLLLVLACIELSDVVFAVDSVPAVFGVTHDPFIVYSSNIAAILGLRALYSVLARAVGDLPYLKPAVALVLGFVGCKMIGDYFGFEISTEASLAVIASILGSGVAISINPKIIPEGMKSAGDDGGKK